MFDGSHIPAAGAGTCTFRKSYPDVIQPCQDGNSDNGTRPLDCSIQGRIFPGEGLGDLSGQPFSRRMSCHLYSQQLPPAVAQNQERKQAIKGQGRNHTQINGGDRLRVVSEKCLPALRRRLRRSHHVFGNRRLSDFEPKHQEFAMDPSRQDSAPWPTQASRLRLRCQSWSGATVANSSA